MIKKNQFWFKAKTYGYGSQPSTWEGWLIIIFYLLLLAIIVKYVNYNNYLFYILITIWTISLVFISKDKCIDEWKWRWGEK